MFREIHLSPSLPTGWARSLARVVWVNAIGGAKAGSMEKTCLCWFESGFQGFSWSRFFKAKAGAAAKAGCRAGMGVTLERAMTFESLYRAGICVDILIFGMIRRESRTSTS